MNTEHRVISAGVDSLRLYTLYAHMVMYVRYNISDLHVECEYFFSALAYIRKFDGF